MTEQALAAVSRPGGLRRELGLGSAAAAVAGEAIAVGIFLTPAGMAKSLGSPFWLLMVWLFMGAISLSGALCFGELAARYPELERVLLDVTLPARDVWLVTHRDLARSAKVRALSEFVRGLF